MEEAKVMLKHIGLTEYETMIYITLLKFGILSAERASELAKIPLPRVYDTVEGLQNKGFVSISNTRPRKFRPIGIKTAIKNFIEIQKVDYGERIKALKSEASSVISALSSIEKIAGSTEDLEEIWTSSKKVNILKMIFDLIKNSKKEIIIFSGDLSWIHEFSSVVQSVTKRHVVIYTIIKSVTNKEVEINVKMARKLGMKVKSGYTGNLRAFVFDGEKLVIVKKMPLENVINTETGKSGSEREFKYNMIEVNDKDVIESIRQNFDFWWNKLD